jgi:hypothetical protein
LSDVMAMCCQRSRAPTRARPSGPARGRAGSHKPALRQPGIVAARRRSSFGCPSLAACQRVIMTLPLGDEDRGVGGLFANLFEAEGFDEEGAGGLDVGNGEADVVNAESGGGHAQGFTRPSRRRLNDYSARTSRLPSWRHSRSAKRIQVMAGEPRGVRDVGGGGGRSKTGRILCRMRAAWGSSGRKDSAARPAKAYRATSSDHREKSNRGFALVLCWMWGRTDGAAVSGFQSPTYAITPAVLGNIK